MTTYTCILVLELELTADLKYSTGQDREAIKRSSALLILKLKECCKLSQSPIDTVVEGCRGLCASTMQHVQVALRSKLADLGFDPSQIVAIQEVFSDLEEPFDNLVTEYQQHAIQLFNTKLLCYDVYHAHALSNGYSYVSLKYKL